MRDTRERIAAVARLAFAVDGPGVPVHEIARRARVSPATVYRYFPTKQDLYGDPLRLCSATIRDGLAHSDAWVGLCLVVERLAERHSPDRALVAGLPAESGFAAERVRSLRLMAELVDRARSTGRLREDVVLEDLVLALTAGGGLPRYAELVIRAIRAR